MLVRLTGKENDALNFLLSASHFKADFVASNRAQEEND